MTPQKSLIPSHFHVFHETLRLLNWNGWSCMGPTGEPFHLGGQLRERFAENFHLASVARPHHVFTWWASIRAIMKPWNSWNLGNGWLPMAIFDYRNWLFLRLRNLPCALGFAEAWDSIASLNLIGFIYVHCGWLGTCIRRLGSLVSLTWPIPLLGRYANMGHGIHWTNKIPQQPFQATQTLHSDKTTLLISKTIGENISSNNKFSQHG